MWLFLLFLTIPLVEIALFIQVGGAIGLFPTLAIVVLTAIIGTWLVRQQGLSALSDMRRSFETLDDPTKPIAHGAMILISGALLLTPGFFTDGVGFALLVPGVRDAVIKYFRARVKVTQFSYGTQDHVRPAEPGVIDGEFTEVGEDDAKDRPPSGWTRH